MPRRSRTKSPRTRGGGRTRPRTPQTRTDSSRGDVCTDFTRKDLIQFAENPESFYRHLTRTEGCLHYNGAGLMKHYYFWVETDLVWPWSTAITYGNKTSMVVESETMGYMGYIIMKGALDVHLFIENKMVKRKDSFYSTRRRSFGQLVTEYHFSRTPQTFNDLVEEAKLRNVKVPADVTDKDFAENPSRCITQFSRYLYTTVYGKYMKREYVEVKPCKYAGVVRSCLDQATDLFDECPYMLCSVAAKVMKDNLGTASSDSRVVTSEMWLAKDWFRTIPRVLLNTSFDLSPVFALRFIEWVVERIHMDTPATLGYHAFSWMINAAQHGHDLAISTLGVMLGHVDLLGLLNTVQLVQALAIGALTISRTIETIRLRMDLYAHKLLVNVMTYVRELRLTEVPAEIRVASRIVIIPDVVRDMASGYLFPSGSV